MRIFGRHRTGRGQGLVEFALVLPVFMFLVLTLFDAGRLLYAQNTITQAARDAVRLGAVSPSFTQTKYDAIRAKARTASIAVGLANTNITGQPGACTSGPADTSSATTCFYPDPGSAGAPSAGERVVVNISTTVPLITPVISAILGNTVGLTAHSVGLIQCTGC